MKTIKTQSSGLPPISSCCQNLCSQPCSGSAQETSARAASQRHILSIRLAGLEQPAGSPHIECEWGGPGKRTGGWACHLDRRPQMTCSYCLRTAVCCFVLFSKINKASVTMVIPGLPPQRQPDGPTWTHLLDSQPGRLMEQVGD